ncbi:M23 family metallopeptidase [Schaalia sp. 19OD2882]|nr:M23 family metallopeptidase [Schaalia sp. 19OD2882]
MLSPASSIALPVRAIGTPVGGSTWVSAAAGLTDAHALTEDLTAASRTRVRSPLTVSQCVPAAAADGTRTLNQVAALYWPVAEGAYEITSPYGPRISPISGQLLMHEGIDMSGAMGEPLYSVADGVVTEVSENSRSGALVGIKHVGQDGEVFYSYYLHQYMDKILVKQGEEVKAGQHIGAIGSNGWSTGPHLHFEIHDSADKHVDPQAWMIAHKAQHVGGGC